MEIDLGFSKKTRSELFRVKIFFPTDFLPNTFFFYFFQTGFFAKIPFFFFFLLFVL